MHEPKIYSQGKEQEVLASLFANLKVGHLLDVGAYVPADFSNTRFLIDQGWTGVLVEPSPGPFKALLDHYSGNAKIELVNAAICPIRGFTNFYDSNGDALSTTDESHRAKWMAGYPVNYRKMHIYGITFDDLFTKFGYMFDFINLDVEGISAQMFMHLPLHALPQTKGLCIEHDGHIQEIEQQGSKFGFKYVFHNGENIILYR